MAVLTLVFLGLVVASLIGWYAVTEERRNKRWVDAMREMGRRCPDCGGVGFHLLLPSGTPDSAPDCRTCNGTGKLGL